MFGFNKRRTLSERAAESAERAKRESERVKKMVPAYGRAQAKKDLSEWRRRIEYQIELWPENPCVTVRNENETMYMAKGLFGWGTHISHINSGGFHSDVVGEAMVRVCWDKPRYDSMG